MNVGDLGGLRRIAIVNRGEPAMRLIHAVGELRIATGLDLRAIALHTAAERAAMFVREADEAVCLDSGGPDGPRSPYLDLPTLETALVASQADAAWVGWGFVAERPEFAELCERLGIVFVGPRPEVMRSLGDKIGAKRLAEQADVRSRRGAVDLSRRSPTPPTTPSGLATRSWSRPPPAAAAAASAVSTRPTSSPPPSRVPGRRAQRVRR